MNVWDVLVALIIVLLVAFALYLMRRPRKCCGCGSCPYSKGCDRQDGRQGRTAT